MCFTCYIAVFLLGGKGCCEQEYPTTLRAVEGMVLSSFSRVLGEVFCLEVTYVHFGLKKQKVL